MSDPTEEDVLDRGEVETNVEILRAYAGDGIGSCGSKKAHRYARQLLAHDAAQRARIEALEAEREGLREALGAIADRYVSKPATTPKMAADMFKVADRALEESA